MEKTKLIIFLLIFMTNISWGQEKAPDLIVTNWSVSGGVGISPILKGKQSDLTQPRGISSSFSPTGTGWLGVSYQMRKNKLIPFSVGLVANYQTYDQTIQGLTFGSDFDTLTNVVHQAHTIAKGYFLGIDVPLKAYLKIGRRSFWSIGISPSFRIFSKFEYIRSYLDGWKPDTEKQKAFVQNRKINLLLITSYRYSIGKKKKSKITLEPFLYVNLRSDNLYLSYSDNYFLHTGIAVNYQIN